jgi:hypothetical protein
MKGLKEGRLEIKASGTPAKTMLTWLGHSDAQNPAQFLTPYFTELINEFKGTEIVADFSKLSYMNSSTVSPIIQFLKMANTKSIKTTVQYDASSTWQSASFKALKAMSMVMKHITIAEK